MHDGAERRGLSARAPTRSCGQRRLCTTTRVCAQVSSCASVPRLNSAGSTHAAPPPPPEAVVAATTAHCSCTMVPRSAPAGAGTSAQPQASRPSTAPGRRTRATPKRTSTAIGHAGAVAIAQCAPPRATQSTAAPSVSANAVVDSRVSAVALPPKSASAAAAHADALLLLAAAGGEEADETTSADRRPTALSSQFVSAVPTSTHAPAARSATGRQSGVHIAGRTATPPAIRQRIAVAVGATTTPASARLITRPTARHAKGSPTGNSAMRSSRSRGPHACPMLPTMSSAAARASASGGSRSSARTEGSRHACAATSGATQYVPLRAHSGQSRRALAATNARPDVASAGTTAPASLRPRNSRAAPPLLRSHMRRRIGICTNVKTARFHAGSTRAPTQSRSVSGASSTQRRMGAIGPLNASVSASIASVQRSCTSTSSSASMRKGSIAYVTHSTARSSATAVRTPISSTLSAYCTTAPTRPARAKRCSLDCFFSLVLFPPRIISASFCEAKASMGSSSMSTSSAIRRCARRKRIAPTTSTAQTAATRPRRPLSVATRLIITIICSIC